MSKQETALGHFTITGNFITEHARNTVLSDMPAKAWRFLSNVIVGEGVNDILIPILKGDKKLDGDHRNDARRLLAAPEGEIIRRRAKVARGLEDRDRIEVVTHVLIGLPHAHASNPQRTRRHGPGAECE